jgi:hypothetical protein
VGLAVVWYKVEATSEFQLVHVVDGGCCQPVHPHAKGQQPMHDNPVEVFSLCGRSYYQGTAPSYLEIEEARNAGRLITMTSDVTWLGPFDSLP